MACSQGRRPEDHGRFRREPLLEFLILLRSQASCCAPVLQSLSLAKVFPSTAFTGWPNILVPGVSDSALWSVGAHPATTSTTIEGISYCRTYAAVASRIRGAAAPYCLFADHMSVMSAAYAARCGLLKT